MYKRLIGYDIDGVLTAGIIPISNDWVAISGRIRKEYDDFAKAIASKVPVYIRHSGEFGDVGAAGLWKANIVRQLEVTHFFEDNSRQASIIKDLNPTCKVYLVSFKVNIAYCQELSLNIMRADRTILSTKQVVLGEKFLYSDFQ